MGASYPGSISEKPESPVDISSDPFAEVADTAAFGTGASGLTGAASSAGICEAVAITSELVALTAIWAGLPGTTGQQKKTSAVSSNNHLSRCRLCESRWLQLFALYCTAVQSSLARWSRSPWYFRETGHLLLFHSD